MKICFIGAHSHVHMIRWYQFFAERGHEVVLISTTAQEKETFQGLPVYPFPMPRSGNYFKNLMAGVVLAPSNIRKLKMLLDEIRPDLVHVHYINDAALLSVLSGFSPVVLTAWGSDVLISPEKSMIRKFFVKHTLKKSRLITCDADHMQKRILELGGAPGRVEIVFFGTNVEKYNPAMKKPEFLSRWGKENSRYVISIRNLEPVYDLETLIRAVPMVVKENPNALFLIGGSGSEKEKLVNLAAQLGVDKFVKFLGSLQQAELPLYLASSDVYVSTALSDGGLAASTAEAMAAATPVVITDVGNNTQWVEDGVSGFVVPPQSPAPLAEKIITLLSSEELRRRLGQKGRDVIVERNNYHRQMERVEGLYRREVELAKS